LWYTPDLTFLLKNVIMSSALSLRTVWKKLNPWLLQSQIQLAISFFFFRFSFMFSTMH